MDTGYMSTGDANSDTIFRVLETQAWDTDLSVLWTLAFGVLGTQKLVSVYIGTNLATKFGVLGTLTVFTVHVSVYLFLMKGPFDDKLEESGQWPLSGTFKAELLDQLMTTTFITYHFEWTFQ